MNLKPRYNHIRLNTSTLGAAAANSANFRNLPHEVTRRQIVNIISGYFSRYDFLNVHTIFSRTLSQGSINIST